MTTPKLYSRYHNPPNTALEIGLGILIGTGLFGLNELIVRIFEHFATH